MISANDFVAAEYSDDLTAAGISVCREGLYRQIRGGSARAYVRLTRQVAAVAVALAFRRYLGQRGIAYRAATNRSFDGAGVGLLVGRNQWHIHSYLISQPGQVAALEADSGLALDAPALIPIEDGMGESVSDDDLHVFAIGTGVLETTGMGVGSASRSPTREFLLHLMPSGWAQPQRWVRIGPVILKAESVEELTVELAGYGEGGEFITRQIRLDGGLRREVDGGFWSVTHIHTRSRPTGRLGISRGRGHRGHVVRPDDWFNIWIDGSKIIFLGWMRHDEFRHRAKTLPAGSPVFQFSITRTANMSVPVKDLKPLARLLEGPPSSSTGN